MAVLKIHPTVPLENMFVFMFWDGGLCHALYRRFETSSPMTVQLLLLHDQWMEGGGEQDDNHHAELGEERQLL